MPQCCRLLLPATIASRCGIIVLSCSLLRCAARPLGHPGDPLVPRGGEGGPQWREAHDDRSQVAGKHGRAGGRAGGGMNVIRKQLPGAINLATVRAAGAGHAGQCCSHCHMLTTIPWVSRRWWWRKCERAGPVLSGSLSAACALGSQNEWRARQPLEHYQQNSNHTDKPCTQVQHDNFHMHWAHIVLAPAGQPPAAVASPGWHSQARGSFRCMQHDRDGC